MSQGPTLNPRYNALLVQWDKDNPKQAPHLPTCEECNRDLTDQPVIELDCWCCETCAQDEDRRVPTARAHYREDFHADEGYGADWLD